MVDTPILNDGIVKICAVSDISKPGARPKQGLKPKEEIKEGLAYEERVVGMSRYWTAKQASATVDRLIRCYRAGQVTTHDIAILEGGEQYTIVQVQYPMNLSVPCMDLSLSRRKDKYEVS